MAAPASLDWEGCLTEVQSTSEHEGVSMRSERECLDNWFGMDWLAHNSCNEDQEDQT